MAIFFDVNARILSGFSSGPAPKPPEDMGFVEKMAFGMSSLAKKANLMRHGSGNASRMLASLFDDPELIRVAASIALLSVSAMMKQGK